MGKIIKKFTIIMLANLIIFLAIWHIIDMLSNNNAKFKIIFLVLSIISLFFLSKSFLKKDLDKMAQELEKDINNNKNNERKY